jgi:hypothetical protein
VGSQKVPRMVVLHCNGRSYGNAYLITFNVGLLHAHTHLLHRSSHCFERQRKGLFGIFWSSAITFHLISSMVVKHVPLRSIFVVWNCQKSLGVRSREYGGWVMTGMLFAARNCCTTSDVWFSTLLWCRKPLPLPLVASLPRTASRNLCKTYKVKLVQNGIALYRVWQVSFLFPSDRSVQKRKLACCTLYKITLIVLAGTLFTLSKFYCT